MTSPAAASTPQQKPHGSACTCLQCIYGSKYRSTVASLMELESSAIEGHLTWLDLRTRAPIVHRSLNALFKAAMTDTSDARRAGRFILSLWSPDQYPLDLNDLGFFERELNFACRHVVNYIIGCQVNFRAIVTYSEMEPIIAAWGDNSA